jgi:hypothetical protein
VGGGGHAQKQAGVGSVSAQADDARCTRTVKTIVRRRSCRCFEEICVTVSASTLSGGLWKRFVLDASSA